MGIAEIQCWPSIRVCFAIVEQKVVADDAERDERERPIEKKKEP